MKMCVYVYGTHINGYATGLLRFVVVNGYYLKMEYCSQREHRTRIYVLMMMDSISGVNFNNMGL